MEVYLSLPVAKAALKLGNFGAPVGLNSLCVKFDFGRLISNRKVSAGFGEYS